MKLKFTLITAIAATCGFVQAGDRSIGDGILPEFLHHFDENEDGEIDGEESQAIRDLRAQMREERRSSIDTDGSGEISRAEIETARAALRARIEERRLEKFNEIARSITDGTENGDEIISLDEYATIPGMDRLPEMIREAIFARLDSDDSGDISSDEFFHRLRRRSDGIPPLPPHGGGEDPDGEGPGGQGSPRPPAGPPHR